MLIALLKFGLQTLPSDLVQQYWDRNIPGSVEIRNEATRRVWTVQIGVNNSEKVKQVLFYSRGWSDFETSNGLVEGDRVTFELTANFTFEVYISKKGVKGIPPVEHPPMEWLKTVETSTLDKSRGTEFGHVTKSARIETNLVAANSIAVNVPTVVCDVLVSAPSSKATPSLSQSNVGNSQNFTRQRTGLDNPPLKRQYCQSSDINRVAPVLSDDQKLRIALEKSGEVWNSTLWKKQPTFERVGNDIPQKKSLPFPCFLKLMTADNYLHCLEIPFNFSSTWGSELQSHINA